MIIRIDLVAGKVVGQASQEIYQLPISIINLSWRAGSSLEFELGKETF